MTTSTTSLAYLVVGIIIALIGTYVLYLGAVDIIAAVTIQAIIEIVIAVVLILVGLHLIRSGGYQ